VLRDVVVIDRAASSERMADIAARTIGSD